MKFAKYWQKVDVPVEHKLFGREQVQVWGASNEGNEAALEQAKSRAGLFTSVFSKDFDRSAEYEYWTGYIKEEVIDRIEAEDGKELAVITRNSYGALVLNTESVMFGDIDLPTQGLLDRILLLFGKPVKDKRFFLQQIEYYQKAHPELSIYVYETFAGLRFVVVNDTYNPNDKFVKEVFKALQVDPLYMKLCEYQTCFRARLTPKPWRIGMQKPETRYPRSEAHDIEKFKMWLKSYNERCDNKAAVRLRSKFGVHHIDPNVLKVLDIHDYYACRSSAELA